MHVPDGYLSPSTCLAFGAVMLPVWATAARKVKTRLNTRTIPLMAVGAAFSFTIMMYNIPIPDGTSAHAVGGALLAVVLGPWAASICISVALAIQALLFGDGGIWSFGANCFTMAFVLPFVAWGGYRLIAGRSDPRSARRWAGAAFGGFLGLNAAALVAGTALGVQPLLFHTPGGTPLYCPFPLHIALPAMMFGHLILAGPLEGVITALVVRYLQRSEPDLLDLRASAPLPETGAPPIGHRLWWGVGALILLSPLGLLARGTAWGEWGTEALDKLVGFVPAGLRRLSATWSHPLFPDYSLPFAGNGGWATPLFYLLCALIGAGVLAALMFLLGRLQAGENDGASPEGRER
jgi:cobalt/nickel transport system permease protein